MRRFGRRRSLLLLVAMFVLATVAACAAGETETQVLLPGNPALTRGGVDRFTNFIEWLLDVPLTAEQRQLVEQSLRDSWKNADEGGITGYTDTLELEAQVSAMQPDQRKLVREQVQPELLKQLRSKPDDEDLRWLLAIYDSGHQPIAKGQPPLTRQTTDAFVELFCFMLSQAVGQKLDAPAELREGMAEFLAEGYPKLSADEQAEFARMPLIWAAFQVAWPAMTDAEKAPYNKQFTAMFKPYLDKVKQAAAAAQAEAQAQARAAATPPKEDKGKTNTPQQTYAIMAAQARYQQMMTNVLQMNANTGRVFAANMGNTYSYHYRY